MKSLMDTLWIYRGVRSLLRPDIHLEFPPPGSVFFQTPKLQCPNFGYRSLQVHGHELSGLSAEHSLDGRDFLEFLAARRVIDHVADAIFATHGRGEESEHGGLADHEREFLRRDIRLGSFLHSEGRHTQTLHRRFEAGHRRHGRFDSHIVRTRGATTDPDSMTMPNPSVVRGAASNGKVEILSFKFFQGSARILREPRIEDIDDAVLENRRFEHTAVEKNSSRVNKRLALCNSRLPSQKCREVTRDAGILRIGQAQLHQSGSP